MDTEIELLNLLPIRVGDDFIDAYKSIGIEDEQSAQAMSSLMDKGEVDIVNDTFILTAKGQERLEKHKEMFKEVEMEEEALSKKVMKEAIWNITKKLVHPAQSFIDDKAYISASIPFPSEKSMVETACIITSDRKVFKLNELPENLQLRLRPMKEESAYAWALPYIQAFLEGKSEKPDLKKSFDEIKSKYEFYIDFTDKRQYTLVTLWVLGTYFHQLFNAYPYIFINASKRSGKTKLLNLTYLLSFNARNFIAPTASSIFRVIRNSLCTLCIDEIEKVNKKEIGDIRAMLLAGYKKGMTVPRTEERRFGRAVIRVVEDYEVYSPKMMANITGVEETLQDRCITIILLRTDNKEIANREIIVKKELPEWQVVRNGLYLNMMLNWKKIVKAMDLFDKLYTGQEIDEEINEYIIKLKEQVSSRHLELWRPVFSMALVISKDVLKEMIELAMETTKEVEEIDLIENVDVDVISALCSIILEDGWYKTAELTKKMQTYEDLDWLKSRYLTKVLSRLKLRFSSRKVMNRKEIFIKIEDLKKIAKRFGLEYDKIREEKAVDSKEERYGLNLSFKIIVKDLDKQNPNGFSREQIIERCVKFGMNEEKVDEYIEHYLIEEHGELYEQTPNKFKLH